MLTTARKNMYPALKKLWQTSFGDDAQYTDFIFDHIPPEQILVWLEDKKIMASLCFQPLTIKSAQLSARAAYMFGFNTDSRYRDKGIGTKLLEGYDKYMQAKGYAASCLAPANKPLFEYYGKRGYQNFFDIKTIKLKASQLKPESGCVLIPRGLDTLSSLRDRFFTPNAVYAQYPRSFLRFINDECRIRGGQVLRICCADKDGYAVCLPMGEKLLINEFAVPPENQYAALYAIYKRFGIEDIEIRVHTDYSSNFESTVLPFVMIRWYDKQNDHFLKMPLQGHTCAYFAHILD